MTMTDDAPAVGAQARTMMMTEPQTVDSGGVRIAYRLAGQGDTTVFALQPFWTGMDEVLTDESGLVA